MKKLLLIAVVCSSFALADDSPQADNLIGPVPPCIAQNTCPTLPQPWQGVANIVYGGNIIFDVNTMAAAIATVVCWFI